MTRILTAIVVLAATPAVAHHEVVMATSLVPLAGGIAVIVAAGVAALRRRMKNPRS